MSEFRSTVIVGPEFQVPAEIFLFYPLQEMYNDSGGISSDVIKASTLQAGWRVYFYWLP